MNVNKCLQSVFLGLLFVMAGINKIKSFSPTVSGLQSKLSILSFLPPLFFQLVIVAVILIEIVCPLMIVFACFNQKFKLLAKCACFILLWFTVLATLLYHFPTNEGQAMPFLKNLAIIGGLWCHCNSI